MRAPVRLPLLLALLAPVALGAQTVRGTVVQAAGGQPADGVMVVLLDAAGRQRGRVLTDGSGGFVVQAPGAGTFRLRAERVGQASVLSEPVTLAGGETRELRLRIGGTPVSLQGVAIAGDARRCRVRPAEGLQTAILWEEARKALNAADWASERQAYRYQALTYRRDLDPQSMQVRDEERRPLGALGRHPFASLPVEELQRAGYVQTTREGTMYYAPDAAALLSDAFLDGHCLRVQEADGREPELVGLAFEPARGGRLADIQGTLWLDRATAELRRLEYRYTNLAVNVPTERLGGRVEFERLPTGAWMVRRWWIRMPAVLVEQSNRRLHEGMGVEQRERELLGGIREEGGEVTAVLNPDGSPLLAARRATLAGLVFDSTRTAPLAAATVFLSGTQFSATTGVDGRFRIDGLPEGEYAVAFHHPRLDTLGVPLAPQRVSVAAGGEGTLELAVPALRGSRSGALASRPSEASPDRPLPVAGLRATGRPRSPNLTAFHRRVAGGNGYFITRQTIERQRPLHTAELFRNVPAFEVVGTRVRLRAAGSPGPSGESARPRSMDTGMGVPTTSNPAQQNPREQQAREGRAREPDSPADCIPAVYLDGTPFEPVGGDLGSLRPDELEGIEVYPRAITAPAQYRRRHSDCGVILIWMKERI